MPVPGSPATSGNKETHEVVKSSWVSVRLKGIGIPTLLGRGLSAEASYLVSTVFASSLSPSINTFSLISWPAPGTRTIRSKPEGSAWLLKGQALLD